MKRLIILSALIVGLLAGVPGHPQADGVNAQKVLPSVVKMQIGDRGHCTAFSINEEKAIYMSAAHCLKGELKIDNNPVAVLEFNEKDDLAVVRSFTSRPAVKLAKGVKVGELVAGIGYGLGTPNPLLQVGYVIGLEFDPFQGPFGPKLIISTGLIPGMSGGPIVNKKGEVISVNQVTGFPDHWYQSIGGGGVYAKVKALFQKYD